jgi:hypothetical protein
MPLKNSPFCGLSCRKRLHICIILPFAESDKLFFGLKTGKNYFHGIFLSLKLTDTSTPDDLE